MFRRIIGLNGDKVTGRCKEQHNEELHSLYSLTNVIRMLTPRRMRSGGHVVRMVEKRNAYKFFVEKS